MPSHRDYLELVARQNAAKPKVAQPPLTVALQQARTVVEHPGWQFFLNSLQDRVEKLETQRAGLMRQMIDGAEMGPMLDTLKVALREVNGELRGLQYAASTIPNIVEMGATLTGELLGAAAPRADAVPVVIAPRAAIERA